MQSHLYSVCSRMRGSGPTIEFSASCLLCPPLISSCHDCILYLSPIAALPCKQYFKMSAISKLTAAFASATNEFTLAAANFSIDFSLMKVEAPVEFHGLGRGLSEHRRMEAESGPPHITARKLGALFSDITPPTPELVKAYGRRVSEIADNPEVNPQGQRTMVFGKHAGADGTSIWAAATSGPGALHIQLLTCMLARVWDGPEAISVWVELVKERKEDIAKQCEDGHAVPYGAVMATRQDISRDQLAEWDASARAWLRTADQAKLLQQKQLMLVIDNIEVPVNHDMRVYSSVIAAWKTALQALENLVVGMPQSLHQEGSILLALSAWHLYPDLLILKDSIKKVEFNDSLIASSGALTLGMFKDGDSDLRGVYWSLSLAHLRYYGEPVVRTQAIARESSRITFLQLTQVALGSLSASWSRTLVPVNAFELAEWFASLGALFDTWKTGNQLPRSESICEEIPDWLHMFVNASRSIIAAKGREREVVGKLLNVGQKHGREFLVKEHESTSVSPCFGLVALEQLLPMLKGPEQRIWLLRQIAEKLHFDSHRIIIRYFVYPAIDQEKDNGFPKDPSIFSDTPADDGSDEEMNEDVLSGGSSLEAEFDEDMQAEDEFPACSSRDATFWYNGRLAEDSDENEDVLSGGSGLEAEFDEDMQAEDECPACSSHDATFWYNGRLAEDSNENEDNDSYRLDSDEEDQLFGLENNGPTRQEQLLYDRIHGQEENFRVKYPHHLPIPSHIEYATAIPRTEQASGQQYSVSKLTRTVHKRWVTREFDDAHQELKADSTFTCDCTGRCLKSYCACYQHNLRCTTECQPSLKSERRPECDNTEASRLYRARLEVIRKSGEEAILRRSDPLDTQTLGSHDSSAGIHDPVFTSGTLGVTGESWDKFEYLFGDDKTAAVYVLRDSRFYDSLKGSNDAVSNLYLPTLKEIIMLNDMGSFKTNSLVSHFRRLANKTASRVLRRKTAKPAFNPGSIGISLQFRSGKEEEWLEDARKNFYHSLNALAAASKVYEHFPDVTIAIGIIEQPIYIRSWATVISKRLETLQTVLSTTADQSESILAPLGGTESGLLPATMLSRAATFSCLTLFESGHFDVDPSVLTEVMALSSGDSIYVAAPLLCDPLETTYPYEMRRVIGNIGRPGITMLVPPANPLTRKAGPENWNVITHAGYDGKREDSFQGTTLHLSFTGYNPPITLNEHGAQDADVFLLESVVSVHDHGKWVADLNVLKALGSIFLARIDQNSAGICSHKKNELPRTRLIAIDSWEEFLDLPTSPSVVRACGNWVARLSLAVASINQCSGANANRRIMLCNDSFCWICYEGKQYHVKQNDVFIQ